MTDLLRSLPCPMPASYIRRQLGLTHEECYQQLVALEARGLVRVVTGHSFRDRKWVWTEGK